MFKSGEDEFLLCYNGACSAVKIPPFSFWLVEFGVYVDKHGDPNRAPGTIEWEGTADRVAVHAPYILLFDSRFIEVRHLETGSLAQIIRGNDIRCIWDGQDSVNPVLLDGSPQVGRVHAVMNAPEVVGGPGSRAVVQQVVELLPVVAPSHLDSQTVV